MSNTEPVQSAALTARRESYYLFGFPIKHSASPALHNALFASLGLPRTYALHSVTRVGPSMIKLCRATDFGGASVTMPIKVAVVDHLDRLTREAMAIGAVNTIVPESKVDGTVELVGTNTDWLGVRNAILSGVLAQQKSNTDTPIDRHGLAFAPHSVAALIIGGGGTCRAAVYALASLACSPIYILNRDAREVAEVVEQFPDINLIELRDRRDIKEYETQIRVVVGCIPAIEPVTIAEKRVWGIVHEILSSSDAAGIASFGTRKRSHVILGPPARRVLLDMCYKPRFTPFMHLAEKHEWMAISGIEAMLEQGFAQSRMWLAKSSSRAVGSGSGRIIKNRVVGRIPVEVEDKARKLIRSMEDIIPTGKEVPDEDDVGTAMLRSKL